MKTFNQFINEGVTDKTSKKGREKGDIDGMRDKVENLLKSSKKEYKQVGNDLAVLDKDDKTIAKIMFRSDYIGIKKTGGKFTDEFSYSEFGKLKKNINKL